MYSGKSSIILLLLRLLDPVPTCATNMSIDGLPLHTIDRSTLRRRIIAVPQDAVFFPDGTCFKINLDPFAMATDEECQAVLETIDLWTFISSRGGLAAGMAADTLSQGLKQLFSLGRAILRRRMRTHELAAEVGETYLAPAYVSELEANEGKSPGAESGIKGSGVLILDEFSSSMDIEIDKAMQEIIRLAFQGYKILMVSHRLEVVMEFNKVLVMDAGRVVEQGEPRELVTREGNRFRDLVYTLMG
jgi:ATP-binding cassette subfamily C (CFTR/MRP) protein 1